MSVYFSKFPNTTHTGLLVKDITRRANLANSVLTNKYAYLPYLIQDDLKPEDVADYYYGGVNYTWLVYYSTGMTDPYYDWPLSYNQFNKYLISKYSDQANTTGNDVITWAMNDLITDNIIHYENSDGDIINQESYTLNPNLVADDWTAIRVYDYEVTLNDNKRAINLLEKSYARRAEEELKDLLNAGII